MTQFNFIDLFAGIGGFRLALESVGGKCVFTSEIDARAQETYRQNFSGEIYGDIREFTDPAKTDMFLELAIPDHDVLAAGFPCQPFSAAGVSARNSLGQAHGLLDRTQGTLFHDIARIAKIKRPAVLILENVSNIIRHDSGRTFDTIKAVFEDELGYSFHHEILNSETLVPQRRRRCYMVAFRDGFQGFEFPVFDGSKKPLKSILEPDVSPDFTISDRSWAGHVRRTKANVDRGVGFTAYAADLDRPSNTLVARYYKDGKECLVPQAEDNPRMLTPRECARLQGFPESFIVHPSKSSAYKQFGNAVTVPVAQAVARKALEHLHDRQTDKTKTLREYGRNRSEEHKARASGEKVSAPRRVAV